MQEIKLLIDSFGTSEFKTNVVDYLNQHVDLFENLPRFSGSYAKGIRVTHAFVVSNSESHFTCDVTITYSDYPVIGCCGTTPSEGQTVRATVEFSRLDPYPVKIDLGDPWDTENEGY